MIRELVDIIQSDIMLYKDMKLYSLALEQGDRWYVARVSNDFKDYSLEGMVLSLESIAVVIDIHGLSLFLHVLLTKLLVDDAEFSLGSNHLTFLIINLEEIFLILLIHALLRKVRVRLDLVLGGWRQLRLVHHEVWVVFLFVLLLAASWGLNLGLVILLVEILSILLWITLFFNKCWLVGYHCVVLKLLRVWRELGIAQLLLFFLFPESLEEGALGGGFQFEFVVASVVEAKVGMLRIISVQYKLFKRVILIHDDVHAKLQIIKHQMVFLIELFVGIPQHLQELHQWITEVDYHRLITLTLEYFNSLVQMNSHAPVIASPISAVLIIVIITFIIINWETYIAHIDVYLSELILSGTQILLS
jgi:hypothetical protein